MAAILLSLLLQNPSPAPRSGRILKGAIRVYRKQYAAKHELGKIRGPGQYQILERGKKCREGYWYRLKGGGWVCNGWFIVGKRRPGGLRNWSISFTPGRYYRGKGKFTHFALSLGALARGRYKRLRKLRGFLPVESRFIGSFPYYRTFFKGYVAANAVEPFPQSTLRGILVTKRDLPLVFVSEPKGAPIYKKTSTGYVKTDHLPKYAVRQIFPKSQGRYLQLRKGKNLYVERAHVNMASRNLPESPKGLKPKERWVHVDLKEDILYAMEGDAVKKVFLTAGSDETPTGVHRVYWKLLYQTFNRQRNKDGYYLEAVPWILFFKESYGIHAAYWHDDFGRIKTHGCINLTPEDAKWVFNFLTPSLPAGYISMRSTNANPGAIIRITR